MDHPEFTGRIWINDKEKKDGLDSDFNDYIDDISGWDFVNNDNDPTDDHGHGTNVAGVALASGNNGIGYAGMNWNSRIMICKVLDDKNKGFYSKWADGIYYAVDNGASVINLSAGGTGSSTVLEDAINYAYDNNVSVVVSTGNDNTAIQYPARYPNAFAIGSTDPDDVRSEPFFWKDTSGSNYGPEIDFVAPGNYMFGLNYKSDTNYNSYWGGTSQAAPHVGGLISLLLSVEPNLSIDDIRRILEESSDDQVGGPEDTEGWDQYYGHGRINAFKALSSPILHAGSFENLNNKMIIYPNPNTADNKLDILNLIDGEYTISVYSTLGLILQNKKAFTANSKLTISIPKLGAGTYLLLIKSIDNDVSMPRKLIIK